MSNWKSERGKVAALSRSRSADDPDLAAARRNLKAARLEEYITRMVAAAPPLTAEQRLSLAAILAGGHGDAA